MQPLLEETESREPSSGGLDLTTLQNFSDAAAGRIRALLASLPDPEKVLMYLNRFRTEAPQALDEIAETSTALRYLLTVFSYSAFLSEEAIRHPGWVMDVAASDTMHRVLAAEEFEDLLEKHLGDSSREIPAALNLARFRRRQLLRIVLRDVLSLGSLSDVTEELSNLADAILHVAYRRIYDSMAAAHGTPRAEIPEGLGHPARFSVIALGKLGGKELNYSSDIDLMFLYSDNGRTDGAAPLTNKEFFKKIANSYTELLSTYTSDGLCYRVDLRLRPDGRYGEVCPSLDGAKNYYKSRARDWELQMLIKARVSAGDREPGLELLDFVEPMIYSTTLDFKAVESVTETRARISEKLKRSPQSGLNVKLARGGIRDIEFLVQCLQRLHGGREPWVRHGGTMLALFRLRDKDLLSDYEYARLVSAYQFLRNLEHRLQFDEDRQTHTLPADIEALDRLARKMPASGSGIAPNAGTLERELDEHLQAVRELYDRVVRTQQPGYSGPLSYSGPPEVTAEPAAFAAPAPDGSGAAFPSINLARLIERKAPAFAEVLATAGLSRNRERFEHFLEKLVPESSTLAALDASPELARCTLDVFAHSNYFADQLIRYPELVEELAQACGARQGRSGFLPPHDAGELRKFFREQMARIQSDSIFHGAPIFKTLKRTSDLADSVIQAAYDIALAHSDPSPGYVPSNRMMVVALGRLGMREFDLASDADLVFIMPDDDARESLFWTGVAERMIQAISAYTGDGVIFTVDTRLRPNGREGALVQTEGFYKDYFARHAEAWEGIAYMKSRAVAGDIERATRFLNELQEVDWRRYGQSGRSRAQLAQMRARLEREQGARNPLKAAPGGYYDIDFVLMYLRLKGAGMFFKVLNTPERIDIIEKMGHLDREEADFLRDAASYYRALDHGLRVATGHAEGRLPSAKSQLDLLTELMERWTPEHLHAQPLAATLRMIQKRTREFFNRRFAQ